MLSKHAEKTSPKSLLLRVHRLCRTVQDETWHNSLDSQGRLTHPKLGYHLVMTNIAMENPNHKMEVSSWENHLFLQAIFQSHVYVK